MNYTLNFENHSRNLGDVCIYQTDLTFDKYKNVMSLAWFTKMAHPETNVNYPCTSNCCGTIKYSFCKYN
ncbi:hypothetical protein [Clostridium saccharoperbutylacetonicum]